MRRASPPLLGIDLSSSSVKVVELVPGQKAGIRLQRYAIESIERGAIADGNVENPDQVAEALRTSGLTPERLCLEVTETALMNQPEVAAASLNELDALGVELAIDDFGTGYSSLSYLKMFPLDVLKIDRCFVSGLPGDVQDSAIVRSVIELAGALGMVVTAEGVEEAAQADALLSLGCRRAQGYLFARPVHADEVTRMLAEGSLSGARSARAGASRR